MMILVYYSWELPRSWRHKCNKVQQDEDTDNQTGPKQTDSSFARFLNIGPLTL